MVALGIHGGAGTSWWSRGHPPCWEPPLPCSIQLQIAAGQRDSVPLYLFCRISSTGSHPVPFSLHLCTPPCPPLLARCSQGSLPHQGRFPEEISQLEPEPAPDREQGCTGMFISPGQQRLRHCFAPACPCIPARDNSIVSRSGRRRYGIRKLVWSCQDRSRSSLICPYHTVLQHSSPTTALQKTPKAWGQRLRCSCATLATVPAVLPAIQGFLRDPKKVWREGRECERKPAHRCICSDFLPG